MSDHKHATDRVDGTIIAECPNKEEPNDGHLSANVEYKDAVDANLYEEFAEAFGECGKCGSDMQILGQEEPHEVLE